MNLDDFLTKIENYKDNLNIENIKKATFFANKAHEGQFRHSNKPYITHPLKVAYTLLEYNLDEKTIIAALLHDVVEDTSITNQDIMEEFGEEVASLVEGVTKLNKINFISIESAQVENLRRFVLASIKDVRVLIIKLSDRLDNMRTIQYIRKGEKRRQIALETINLYVPMAERISLNEIKDELEDLSFAVLEPKSRQFIVEKIEEIIKNSEVSIEDVVNKAKAILKDYHIDFIKVYGRIKRPYSIWRKIKNKSSNFEDLFDIVAFRIITLNTPDCYKVLYALHSQYKAFYQKFKDYISYPKSNGYQSLHTCVYINVEKNIKAEFQIRTEDMHNYAENGIASHWNYKNSSNNVKDIDIYAWLKSFLDRINNGSLSLEEMYEYSSLSIYSNEVFVFTPKGEIVNLPQGSTALDFAYEIHTSLGSKCSKVIIDGIYKSIFTELKNGDKVEIITEENQEPQIMWLSFVKTGFAKYSIKKQLKQKYNKELKQHAISVLTYFFEKEGLTFYPELVTKLLPHFNLKSESMFFEKILEGKISIRDIINFIHPNALKSPDYSQEISTEAVAIKSLDLFAKEVKFSECCFPVYGDTLVAVLVPGDKAEIHHSNCEILYSNSSSYNNSLTIIQASWNNNTSILYRAKIRIALDNQIGAFAAISQILAKNSVNILSISYKNASYTTHYMPANEIIILIKNVQQLETTMKNLRESPFVKNVERRYN